MEVFADPSPLGLLGTAPQQASQYSENHGKVSARSGRAARERSGRTDEKSEIQAGVISMWASRRKRADSSGAVGQM